MVLHGAVSAELFVDSNGEGFFILAKHHGSRGNKLFGNREFGHLFLKQDVERPDHGIGMEKILEAIIAKDIGQAGKSKPLMMRVIYLCLFGFFRVAIGLAEIIE